MASLLLLGGAGAAAQAATAGAAATGGYLVCRGAKNEMEEMFTDKADRRADKKIEKTEQQLAQEKEQMKSRHAQMIAEGEAKRQQLREKHGLTSTSSRTARNSLGSRPQPTSGVVRAGAIVLKGVWGLTSSPRYAVLTPHCLALHRDSISAEAGAQPDATHSLYLCTALFVDHPATPELVLTIPASKKTLTIRAPADEERPRKLLLDWHAALLAQA
eukprot:m.75013 g.75013  ORF g.75013 m.75013 type:complete len:216 (+) comp17137_c0_seq1:1378-2025(+)